MRFESTWRLKDGYKKSVVIWICDFEVHIIEMTFNPRAPGRAPLLRLIKTININLLSKRQQVALQMYINLDSFLKNAGIRDAPDT